MVCNDEINFAYMAKKMFYITLEFKKNTFFLDSQHPNDTCIGIVLMNLAYFQNYMQHSSYYIFL